MRFSHRDPLTMRIARTVRETTLATHDWFESAEPVYIIGMSGPPRKVGLIGMLIRRLMGAIGTTGRRGARERADRSSSAAMHLEPPRDSPGLRQGRPTKPNHS